MIPLIDYVARRDEKFADILASHDDLLETFGWFAVPLRAADQNNGGLGQE